jgi:hypothetical protein
MERGEIMNLTTETVINLFLALCSLLTFLLGMIIGRRIGRKEMNDVTQIHKFISSIWRDLLLLKTKEYTALLREYIKLAKE